ncbi:ABC transporter substrate-binding protein [Opitutaceae bacterium TAV5]|nr:ABC transporter substrate-binding protein [Opitutaceae bacterium TAV5]
MNPRLHYPRLVSLLLVFSLPLSARSLTDAAGRSVTVPDSVQRVAGTAPPPTLLVYALAPDLLVSSDTPAVSSFYAPGTRLLLPEFTRLPVVGGWHGSSRGANMEALLALDPQVVVAWRNDFAMEPVLRSFEKFDIPVVFVNQDRVADIPGALRLVGQAIGRAEAGEKLARDAEARLAQVRKTVGAVPPEKRPSIYYAQGADGLLTQFSGSYHFDPFLVAGGRSLFPGEQKTMMGMERVSLEQILESDPAVIVATDTRFARAVRTDSRWSGIAAVRDDRVLVIPRDPVNWLDRPPCFMRVLGVQWLASVLYPEAYPGNIVQETITFYRDYLHQTIDEKTARHLLAPQ